MDLSEVVLLDFETRSRADLKAIGGRNYAADPSTEVLCCVFYAEGEYLEWRMGDPPPPYAPILAAHNAVGFDMHVWRRLGWPEPRQWLDTSELARSSGLPGKLEDLGHRICGVEKDKEGNAYTLSLSRPSRAKATFGELPPITPDVLDRVVAYCKRDVEVMVALWPHVEDFVDLEPEVLEVWRRSNDRGVLFDRDLARALLAADAKVAAEKTGLPVEAIRDDLFRPAAARLGVALPKQVNPEALRKILRRTHGVTYTRGKNPKPKPCVCLECTAKPGARELLEARLDVSGLRHAATFVKWVHEAGGGIESAEYENVEPLTRSPVPELRELAVARLAVASIAAGKLRAGLARCSPDGRMRDNVRYFGAHTGRGSGGGMQLQNLPKPSGLDVNGEPITPKKIDGKKWPGWTDERVCAEVAAPRDWNQDEIGMLLRACIMAPPGCVLVAADYSGVEARANAWAAGDDAAVAVFRLGGDAYKPLACKLFGIDLSIFDKETHFWERDTSKKAELGCGYQMGAPKFTITAEAGGMKWKDPALCRGPGLCTDPVCGYEEKDKRGQRYTHGAATIVATWRELHKPIVDFWYALERAAVESVDSRAHIRVDCSIDLSFDFEGKDLAMILPSGRPIVYRNSVIVPGKFGPQVRYLGARFPQHLYGGLLCENGIQATCREFLVRGMINAEDAGLPVVLTVHDEIVSEVERRRADTAKETLIKAITTLPAWADGMPIAAEGFVCERYRK